MSLVDRLVLTAAQCRVGQIIDELPEDECRALCEALVDEAFTSTRIAAALKAEGYFAGRTTVADHRAGRCCCAK